MGRKHQDRFIENGIACLVRNGIKKYRIIFYVLIGFNTDMEYDLFRVRKLKELGVCPFVMPFDKNDRYQKDIARWANCKRLFGSMDFDDYDCPTNKNR